MTRKIKKSPGRMAWYASGGGIERTGPFASEMDAREAMRLTDDARERQRRKHGTASPFPIDLCVWHETNDDHD